MNTIILLVLFGSSFVLHGTTAKTGITRLVKRSQKGYPAANITVKLEHPLHPGNDLSTFPSTEETKRGKHKHRKRKDECTCLSDLSSCGYNNESYEKMGNRLHGTDVKARNESRSNTTYIQVDCLTLCQTYTCRVNELNSSQRTQSYDQMHSSNNSSEALAFVILWLLTVIVVVMLVFFIIFTIRNSARNKPRKTESQALFREKRNKGHQEEKSESITKGDLFTQAYQYNKYKQSVNTVDASKKSWMNFFKAGPRGSHCKGAKGVGTQYATDEVEQLISCSINLEENLNSKGRKNDNGTKTMTTTFIEAEIDSKTDSNCTTDQAIREHRPKHVEGDVAYTKRNQITYQESEVATGNDVQVSIVKPLGTADEKKEAAKPPRVLNWDEIFRHLAKSLPTSDWQLFFNILYGNCHHLLSDGRDMGSYISRVENNVRRSGGGVETLMFELFKQWKQLMGSDVNITCIEQALEDRSYNSTLEDFRKFMRNPPLLPEIPNRQRCQSLVSLDVNNTLDNKAFEYIPLVRPNYATFMLPSVPQYSIPQSENRRTNTVTSGPIIQEMEDQFSGESSLQSSSSTPSSGRESLSSSNDTSIGRKRKRLMLTRDIQGGEAQVHVTHRKQRKKDTTGQACLPLKWKKGRRRNKQRADTESELHEMKQSMIEMTKQYLPLSEMPLQVKQYNVYLEHTIECIIKQTWEPRHKVLSLSHEDFCNLETFETKRKEKFYFLYSGDCCLVLKHSQYETLRLYAEHARRNLVRDIKKKLDDKYKEPDALFLAHDGQPIIEKKKARKTRSNKEPTTREETMSCAAYDEEKHCLSSSANRRDILEDTTNKFQNHEEYAESIESQDGAISGITSGRNAVVKPYSTEKKQPEKRNLGVFDKQDESLNTEYSLEPCKRESECVKHQTYQNTQQLDNAISTTKQAIQTEIEYSQVCETETGLLNNTITLNNENNIAPISNCESLDKTTLESSVDSSEEFEYERSTTQAHIYQHLTKTHNESCHSTGNASCEDKPTSVKMDTDNLSEVFSSNCEAVIHNVQENNFEINRGKNSNISTIKLDNKSSIIGNDKERRDDTISDDTKSDLFGKTKEDFSKTTSNSSPGTTTEDLSQTVGSISLRDTKEGTSSAVFEENIPKTDTTSSKTVLESGGTSAKELDGALVYACISSIMQAEPDVKNSRDIDVNIELD